MKPVSNWYTPEWLFNRLSLAYGPFDLDVAAAPENAKCERYFDEQTNGLEQPWTGRVWCNPPYRDLIKWVRKAREETMNGNAEKVVMLLPAQTSTAWWHDYALKFANIVWIRGKVQFGGCKDRAIMPSVVLIFTPEIQEVPVANRLPGTRDSGCQCQVFEPNGAEDRILKPDIDSIQREGKTQQ